MSNEWGSRVTRDDLRPPAVAGQFYPADAGELRGLVAECLAGVPRDGRVCPAALLPHAGLVYSGRTAAAVLGRLALPPVVVILCPNHTGRLDSTGASLWARGGFATPLGVVPVAAAFASRLALECELVAPDAEAHRAEHAIEVELPFLQVLAPASAIVPIVIAWDDWRRSDRLAATLAAVARRWPEPILLLASSDLNHYEPATVGERKDRLALERIESLDGHGLLDLCRRERISMCGRAPAAIVLEAAKRLGATSAEVVDYRHSGWVTGDDGRVVGYAGVLVA